MEYYTGAYALFDHPDPAMTPEVREELFYETSLEVLHLGRVLKHMFRIPRRAFPHAHILSLMSQSPVRRGYKIAYEKWKADPQRVLLIDVRTPEEYLFVGHPAMAWRIPVAAQSYEWDAGKEQFPMKLLPDFVSRVNTVAKPDDTILVMCRSGGRSAIAVNLLAKAGFKNVYNITDGMEVDVVNDPASVFQGFFLGHCARLQYQ